MPRKSRPVRFRTFDEVLKGIRALIAEGYEARFERTSAATFHRLYHDLPVQMRKPVDRWSVDSSPLLALGNRHGLLSILDDLDIVRATAIGLSRREGQWTLAVIDNRPEWLMHIGYGFWSKDFVKARKKLLDACGLSSFSFA